MTTGNNTPHHDDIRTELRRLWIEHPELSATQIGLRIGLNKNQVMGMKSRLVKSGFINAAAAQRAAPRNFSTEQVAWKRQHEREIAAAKRLQRAQILAGVQQPALRVPTPRPVFVAPVVAPVVVQPPPEPPAAAIKTPLPTPPVEPCQFVINDGRPWIYCDAPGKPGSPYCPTHHRLCYGYRPEAA